MYLLDVEKFKKLLQDNQKNFDAVMMKKYMKDHFDFYGVKSLERKSYFTMCLYKLENGYSESELQKILTLLWNEPQREMHYAAMDLLDKSKRNLDITWLPFLEHMILTKSWWDTVDHIASHYLGMVMKKLDYSQQWQICERWIESESLWLQRCAIIFQLQYKKDTNFDIMKKAIWGTLENKNFFIRKAAGWALREYSKTKPHEVKTFIEEYVDILDNLTLREAKKYLL